MVIVEPDFERRIDLPGAGPCPRPVDIDRNKADLSRLVSLRVYSFAAGVEIDGEAEEDEVYIVLMRGLARFAVFVAGAQVGDFALDTTGGARALYMPPHSAYHLTATGDCDIAYARADPTGATLPDVRTFAPEAGRLVVTDHATGMDLTLATHPAGETVAVVGVDAGLPERFVHIRADNGGVAMLSSREIGNWGSLLLGDGEDAALAIIGGAVDLLTVSATRRSG